MARTISSFLALDNACYADGRSYDAHTARQVVRNANRLNAYALRRVVSKSWPGADDGDTLGFRISPIGWRPYSPPLTWPIAENVVRVGMRIYATVENARTVYAWVGPATARPPPIADASVLAMAGNGAAQWYPAIGAATKTFRARATDGPVRIWFGGFDEIAVTENTGISTGAVTEDFGRGIADTVTPADFSVIDGVAQVTVAAGLWVLHSADFYLRFERGGNRAAGSYRIWGQDGGSRAFLEAFVSENQALYNATWRLHRGPRAQIFHLGIYEQPITVLRSGTDDAEVYAQQKLVGSTMGRLLMGLDTVERERRRVHVLDWFILPRHTRLGVSPAWTAVGTYPIEISRGTASGEMEVRVGFWNINTGTAARVETRIITGVQGGAQTIAATENILVEPHWRSTHRWISDVPSVVTRRVTPANLNQATESTHRHYIGIEARAMDAQGGGVVIPAFVSVVEV